ncbi:hypothetical protein H6S82_15400 [Planktothrix sp. FACHB-1355]|uniref:Uncharacterized protein n=1 Tax=Aerosakkonema funiforme FACHB-1375 TaxID=2949571 RepID=A0A926VPY3_9CYAN|nr:MULTISPECIES: hypothetical protein [Oscillatoriales]MBD2186464.1 hypothetical protein [Aerosakkonema funiforme FACHB-1375]MBD3560227.1 hypothetical protein [Planktothrix sp. FACHB-1355]
MKILTSLVTAMLLAGSTIALPVQARRHQDYKTQSLSDRSLSFDRPSPASASNADSTYHATGARKATVFAPPSNVRDRPNGNIVCRITTRRQINVYRFYDNSQQWLSTDACGDDRYGVIHISQIRF